MKSIWNCLSSKSDTGRDSTGRSRKSGISFCSESTAEQLDFSFFLDALHVRLARGLVLKNYINHHEVQLLINRSEFRKNRQHRRFPLAMYRRSPRGLGISFFFLSLHLYLHEILLEV